MVVLNLPDDWRERVTAALKQPVWPIYLGRKSCVPSRPVFEGVTEAYSDLLDAIQRYPVCMRKGDKSTPQALYYECETSRDGAGSFTRPDERLSGGREFGLRTIYRGVITREGQDVSDEN